MERSPAGSKNGFFFAFKHVEYCERNCFKDRKYNGKFELELIFIYYQAT